MKSASSYCRDALLMLVVVFPLSNLALIPDNSSEKLLGLLESKDKKVVESAIRQLAEERPDYVRSNEKYKQLIAQFVANRNLPPHFVKFPLLLSVERERRLHPTLQSYERPY